MSVAKTMLFFFGIGIGIVHPRTGCSFSPFPLGEAVKIWPAHLIAYGEILRVENRYTDFQVLEILAGAETRDTIRIWDGATIDCNGPFQAGTEAMGKAGDSVLAFLPRITDKQTDWQVEGDYRMQISEYRLTFNFQAGKTWYPENIAPHYGRFMSPSELKAQVLSILASSSIRGQSRKGGNKTLLGSEKGGSSGHGRNFDLLGQAIGSPRAIRMGRTGPVFGY